MDHPTAVSKTTPAICAAISGGVCKKPRLTIWVVAPTGGCEDSKEQQARVRDGQAHHAAVFDGDIPGVTVGVEHEGRLSPPVHVLLDDAFFEEQIYPDGPLPARTA